jgi:hypothetical protein
MRRKKENTHDISNQKKKKKNSIEIPRDKPAMCYRVVS